MIKIFLFICGLFFINTSFAAWERNADQRTLTPGSLPTNRKIWGADLNVGYSQLSGNVESTSAKGEFLYFKKREENSFYWQTGLNYGLSRGVVTQNQGQTALRHDHQLNENWKTFVFNTHAYNKFLKLDYRTALGGGLWYDFKGEGWINGVSLAPTFVYEVFSGFDDERATLISFRNYFENKINENSELGFDFFFCVNTADGSDYLTFFQPYFQTAISEKRLSLKLSYSVESDSQPKPGVKSTDFQYFTSLVFHFGE